MPAYVPKNIFVISCTPDQENYHIYSVTYRHKISVSTSESGKVNTVFPILKKKVISLCFKKLKKEAAHQTK